MKIKESIYIPSVPIQELYSRLGAVLPSDRDDYLVGIPNESELILLTGVSMSKGY